MTDERDLTNEQIIELEQLIAKQQKDLEDSLNKLLATLCYKLKVEGFPKNYVNLHEWVFKRFSEAVTVVRYSVGKQFYDPQQISTEELIDLTYNASIIESALEIELRKIINHFAASYNLKYYPGDTFKLMDWIQEPFSQLIDDLKKESLKPNIKKDVSHEDKNICDTPRTGTLEQTEK